MRTWLICSNPKHVCEIYGFSFPKHRVLLRYSLPNFQSCPQLATPFFLMLNAPASAGADGKGGSWGRWMIFVAKAQVTGRGSNCKPARSGDSKILKQCNFGRWIKSVPHFFRIPSLLVLWSKRKHWVHRSQQTLCFQSWISFYRWLEAMCLPWCFDPGGRIFGGLPNSWWCNHCRQTNDVTEGSVEVRLSTKHKH